jgi:hypothetical protein
MKITIGYLIKKELENPDSEMSRRVRQHKAYTYLCKKDPEHYKMSLNNSINYRGFTYFHKDKVWSDTTYWPSSGTNIGSMLKLI